MHIFHKYHTYDIGTYDTKVKTLYVIEVIKQCCECGKERQIVSGLKDERDKK